MREKIEIFLKNTIPITIIKQVPINNDTYLLIIGSFNQINIKNFRNHKSSCFDFCNTINILVGKNAQGKTNVLEAIHILCTTKSFRYYKDEELINLDENFSKIEAQAEVRGICKTFEARYSRDGKKCLLINGKRITKSSDFVGSINVSVLCPEDIMLIQGDGSFRRRYLDIALSQVDKVYLDKLIKYQKILKNKNYLLKMIKLGKETRASLDPWEEQMYQISPVIFKKRNDFIDKVKKEANKVHYFLSSSKENLVVRYQDSVLKGKDTEIEEYEVVLRNSGKKLREEEIARGTTVLGPHRDDVAIEINGMSVKHYGSQGQQRTAAISLRLAEVGYIQEEINEFPILLVDDIFSELDDRRKEYLMHLLKRETQMFMTGTRLSEFEQLVPYARVFNIEKGEIIAGGYHESSNE